MAEKKKNNTGLMIIAGLGFVGALLLATMGKAAPPPEEPPIEPPPGGTSANINSVAFSAI